MEGTAMVRRALLAMQRHSWEQGVAMQAMLETGEWDALVAMAHDAVTRQDAQGRAAIVGDDLSAVDTCGTGEGLMAAARRTGESALEAGFRKLLDWAVLGAPRASDGTVYHLMDRREVWSDSMYMVPPFLAAAGRYDAALSMARGLLRRLRDPQSGLMAWKWDDETGTPAAPEHWGVGLGWTLAGLARVQAALPPGMARERDALREDVRALLSALCPHTRADGLFHNIVDDPGSFVETNLSQMAAYTVYRGLREGWLPPELFGWAERMRAAACAKVDAWGLVRGVCGAPRFDAPGIAPEGQAFHLLMERSRADWMQSKG